MAFLTISSSEGLSTYLIYWRDYKVYSKWSLCNSDDYYCEGCGNPLFIVVLLILWIKVVLLIFIINYDPVSSKILPNIIHPLLPLLYILLLTLLPLYLFILKCNSSWVILGKTLSSVISPIFIEWGLYILLLWLLFFSM